MSYENILVEQRGKVAIITLNRPKALNALSPGLTRELAEALDAIEADEGVSVVVLTGSDKAFAAGADIKEMEAKSSVEMALDADFGGGNRLAAVRTPKIAAVSGYALGGGCELALMCDLVIAADSARFGQPEITLGVIPGMGGSQRLARAIGRYKTADLVLTGRMMDAAEAERSGIVSRIVPAGQLLEEVGAIAETIAAKSIPALYAATAVLDAALETPLAEGLRFEKQAFAALFATDDQKEGMAAFREKRAPQFSHR